MPELEPVELRNAPVDSPEWWLVRLLNKLEDRKRETDFWERYYQGDHPLSMFSRSWAEAFQGRFHRFSSNFVLLIVDGLAERLEVQGFRFASPQGDDDLWAIWQANDLDGASQAAHTEALVKGIAYTLVERVPGGAPRITVESADDCITESDPRDRRLRLAGLKRWIDADGHLVVYVYSPERVYKYVSVKTWPDDHIEGWPSLAMTANSELPAGGFARLELPEEDWGATHSVGRVPLVPIVNDPDIDGCGKSVVEPITSHQDAINYYRAGAIIGSRYLAIPQRYIANMRLKVDPDTGLAVQPFRASTQDLWVIEPREGEDEPDPKFDYELGQFPAADLTPYIRLIEAEVWQMSAISRMPYEELLAQPTALPSSGEAKKSSESALIRKVGRTQVHFGEGWEETMRTALAALDDERRDLRTAATFWASPETRNEAVRTDSIVKLIAAGVIDDEAAWDMLDLTTTQKAELRKRRDERREAAAELARNAPPPPVVPAPTGPRMSPTPSSPVPA